MATSMALYTRATTSDVSKWISTFSCSDYATPLQVPHHNQVRTAMHVWFFERGGRIQKSNGQETIRPVHHNYVWRNRRIPLMNESGKPQPPSGV